MTTGKPVLVNGRLSPSVIPKLTVRLWPITVHGSPVSERTVALCRIGADTKIGYAFVVFGGYGRNAPRSRDHFIPVFRRTSATLRTARRRSLNTDTSSPTPVLYNVAFVHCFDSTTLMITVWLDPAEADRLRDLLAALKDYGLILPAAFDPLVQSHGFAAASAAVRGSVGAHFVDAALDAAAGSVRGSDPNPVAVMPVWAFEQGGHSEDVLVSSAKL